MHQSFAKAELAAESLGRDYLECDDAVYGIECYTRTGEKKKARVDPVRTRGFLVQAGEERRLAACEDSTTSAVMDGGPH